MLAGGFAVTVVVASAAAWIVGWMMAAAGAGRSRRDRFAARSARFRPPSPSAWAWRRTRPVTAGRVAAWSGVLGVAVAVTGVLVVSTIGASADHLRHTPSLFGVSADFAVNTEVDDPDAAAEAAIGALLADPDVEAVASVLGLSTDSADAHGPNGAAASVDPEALRPERGLIGPTIRSGRLATGSDEVVLGRATADALGAELGDHVTVTRVDDRSVDYVVVGLAVSYGIDVVDEGFHVTEDGIERLAVPCGPDWRATRSPAPTPRCGRSSPVRHRVPTATRSPTGSPTSTWCRSRLRPSSTASVRSARCRGTSPGCSPSSGRAG